MTSNTSLVGISQLHEEFRASSKSGKSFSNLAERFDSKLNQLASKYPDYWHKDFVQEGLIGLNKAAENFPITSSSDEFENYAIAIISNTMTDFYRTVIGKTMTLVTEVDLEGDTVTTKVPIFVSPPQFYNEEEDVSWVETIPASTNNVSNITFSIDYNYVVNKKTMKKQYFSEEEIRVFELHFNNGYSVTEVANKMAIPVYKVSRIIGKTKVKIQKLLAITSNNNLN